MKSKKISILLLTLCLLCSNLFAADLNIPIYFNQTLINSSETPAYISDSRTFIPVRAVGNVLHLNVDWQSPNVVLSGKHQVSGKPLTVSINTQTQTVVLNNHRLTRCIELKNGRSYVTLRVLAEAFGFNVIWENKTVYITTPSNHQSSDDTTSTTDSNTGAQAHEEETKNDASPTVPPSTSQATLENQVLTLVNAERNKQGLSPLVMDESLRSAARLKSSDMREKNYFSHTSPTYGSPFEMLKTLGISYTAAAENIAQGYSTPESVVKGWMNSAGHRANILNGSYTHIGIGYDANGHYWTQLFIKR